MRSLCRLETQKSIAPAHTRTSRGWGPKESPVVISLSHVHAPSCTVHSSRLYSAFEQSREQRDRHEDRGGVVSSLYGLLILRGIPSIRSSIPG